jgi:pimeloyl-ACP methyl ester carboxylesterase
MRNHSPLALATLYSLAFCAVATVTSVPDTTQAQQRPTARTVRINDIEMHYQVRGTGEPLLLLHGFFACGTTWDPFVEALGDRYQLIIPDLRGHGKSSNPAGTFTNAQSARDVLALLDTLGMRRVRAIGTSAGAMALMHLATLEPDRVESMVLVSGTTHFPESARAFMSQVAADKMPPPARAEALKCAARGEPQLRSLQKAFGAFRDKNADDMKLPASRLGTIKARTLIVHGDRDEGFPVDIPVAMYKGIPGSALWIVPQGEHVPISGPRAREFQEVTLRFLQGDSGRQR